MVNESTFYRRWIVANGVAEGVGLGATLGLGFSAAHLFPDTGDSAAAIVLAALAAVVAGILLEGVLVGASQGWVLRSVLPSFPVARWTALTAVGAGLAWLAGMLPSTLMAIAGEANAPAHDAARMEPPLGIVLLLAAGMGLALGPFLGVPQGLVLRRYGVTIPRWVLANSLAWAAGMPVVFTATAAIDERSSSAAIAVAIAVATLAAGLVVGAIHGRFILPAGRGTGNSPSRLAGRDGRC